MEKGKAEIDRIKTGENINKLRKARKFKVRDLQEYFDFSSSQTIYKWQQGATLPSVEHLCLLSRLFGVPMEEILVVRE